MNKYKDLDMDILSENFKSAEEHSCDHENDPIKKDI
jgi:hypothetical protein